MKFYMHFEGEPEFALLVNWGQNDVGTIQTLKQRFVEAFNRRHGHLKTLHVTSISIRKNRTKTLADNAEVSRVIEHGEDVFVVEEQTAPSTVQPKVTTTTHSTATTPASTPKVASTTTNTASTSAAAQSPPSASSQSESRPHFTSKPKKSTHSSASSHRTALEIQGIELFKRGELDEALKKLNQTIETEKPSMEAYSTRALILCQLQRWEETILDTNRCLVQNEASGDLFIAKGIALLHLNELRAAYECFYTASKMVTSSSQKAECNKYMKEAKSALAKRLELKNEDDAVRATYSPEIIQQSLAVAQMLEQKGSFDQAVQIYLELLETNPADKTSLSSLGNIYLKQAQRYNRAIEYFTRGFILYPKDPSFIHGLAESYYGLKDYGFAAKCYGSLLTFSSMPNEVKNFQAKLARCMHLNGDREIAWSLLVPILREDPDNFEALHGYGIVMRDTGEYDEASKVFLKMLLQQSDNQAVREQLALSIRYDKGFEFVRKQFMEASTPASAFAFLAVVIKDWGEVEKAAILYEDALRMKPDSASYCLNLVHALEVLNQPDRAFNVIKDFCKANPTLHISSLTCAHIYNEICHIDTLTSHVSWKRPKSHVNSAQKIPITKVPPEQPADKDYTSEQLDLLALFCTLVKIVYITGVLELIEPLSRLINPTREGRQMHTTMIRNEHAYFCCVNQLMPSKQIPLEDNDRIYVAGDSHSLCPAWHTLNVKGKRYMLHPLLVTGLKIWHLRPESSFYPKRNFWNVVPKAPRGSKIIMLFGEIDCREGFVVSVQKCRYKNIEEAAMVTIEIYIQVLQQLQQEYDYQLFIHPPPPVLDITRPIVMTFTRLLKQRVLDTPGLHWLDFQSELVTSDDLKTMKLRPEYELDGTHLNPAYLKLLEKSLEQYL